MRNGSERVEDFSLPAEPLLDDMVLCGLPGSLCCMAERAKPSVTLYFHLSAYQREGPKRLWLPSPSSTCSTGHEQALQSRTTKPHLICCMAHVTKRTPTHWLHRAGDEDGRTKCKN